MKHLVVIGALVGAVSVAGCGHENPPAQPPPMPAAAPTVTSGSPKSDRDVSVSEDVRMICNIEDTEKSPKFDFDSTTLSSGDRDVLQQVAKCMTEGPLKGKNVQLVGRADNRGEAEYNMTLGGSRAQAAKQYLTGLGVAANRVGQTSRGELDATGKDEAGYQRDRRVDVRLAK